jgi:hypothetical protein
LIGFLPQQGRTNDEQWMIAKYAIPSHILTARLKIDNASFSNGGKSARRCWHWAEAFSRHPFASRALKGYAKQFRAPIEGAM